MTTTDALPNPQVGIRYEIRTDGDTLSIFRVPPDGQFELVATMDGTTIVYANEKMSRYAPALKRALKKQSIPYTASVVGNLQPAAPVETKEPTMTATQPPPQPAPQAVDPLAGLSVEVRKCIRSLRDKEGYPTEIETDVPAKPTIGKMGDKTPEYVEWLLRYDPLKFHETYKIQGFGKVKLSEKFIDQKDNMVKDRHIEKSGVLTYRKTHLTLTDPDTIRRPNK